MQSIQGFTNSFVNTAHYKDQVVNSLINFFSPKQNYRPDSMLDCCRQMLPYLHQSFAEQSWKVSFTAQKYLNFGNNSYLDNSTLALSAINRLETAITNNQTADFVISEQEARCIEAFLCTLPTNDSYKLSAYLSYQRHENLWRTLKACRELFQPIQEDSVETLQRKMDRITQSSGEPIESPFKDEDKLTAQDLRLLTVASTRQKTLEILRDAHIEISSADEMYQAWTAIRQLNESPVMQNIRERSKNGYTPGRIFFFDWNFIKIKDFYQFDTYFMVKHVLYSRIPHLGIIVNDSHNQPNFSHVNGGMGTHGIHPIRFPLMGALGNFGELNITPLMPPSVTEEHRTFLQDFFTDTFIKFAAEEHPEVALEHNPTCWLGHTSSEKHGLSEVNLSANQPQFCSSYVGVIFLKAVHEVNVRLRDLGYEEQIAHPFGEHEIVDRVDTLRLLYHWKKLNVLNVVPLDAFVNKVFASPTL